MPRKPIDLGEFRVSVTRLKRELLIRFREGTASPANALQAIFQELCDGHYDAKARLQFYVMAAPIAREAALEALSPDSPFGDSGATIGEVTDWFKWLIHTNPVMARAIDLYDFADLTLKETSDALGLPVSLLTNELQRVRNTLVSPTATSPSVVRH